MKEREQDRAPVVISVQDGRGRLLFSERRRLGVARALSALLDHLASEAAAYQMIDPVASAQAASDAIRVGRVTRAAVRMK